MIRRPRPALRPARAALSLEIAIGAVLVGSLPLVLVVWLLFQAAERTLTDEARHELATVADQKVALIEGFARDRLREATILAYAPSVLQALDRLAAAFRVNRQDSAAYVAADREYRHLLTRYADSYGAADLVLISAAGDVVFSVSGRDLGANILDGRPDHLGFAQVFERARTLLEAETSDAGADPGHRLGITVAAPVIRDGTLLGVVAFRIDRGALSDIARDYSGLGRSGEILIAGTNGATGLALYGPLRHPEDAPPGQAFSADTGLGIPLARALHGGRGLDTLRDGRGRSVLAAWRYLPSFGLGLVVEIDRAEILAGVERLRRLRLWTTLLSLGLAGVVSVFLGRGIAAPLHELEEAIRALSRGSFEPPLEVAGSREIVALAQSFNAMAVEIQSYQTGLKRMVEERTAELRAAKDTAEAATRAKSEFLAMMSHELRTPMTGLMGMAELLNGRLTDPVDRGYLRTILQSGETLTVLLGDLLDMSRVDAGQVAFDNRPFAPAALASELAALMRVPAEDKGLRLSTRVAADMPPLVLGDPARLRQILLNLLGNAIKFTERGSVTLGLERLVPETPTLYRLRFSVADTGIGIAAAAQAHLFDPFFQVDGSATRRHGGAGLGLAIAKRLADGMGGSIAVESRPGQGSRFSLILDFAAASSAPVSDGAAAPRAETGPLRILLVEDEEVNRQVLTGLLERAGHRVRIAHTGAEAVAAVAFEPFDVVLADLRLPGMDGLEATRRMRALAAARGSALPVVAVTANLMAEDLAACRAAGMVAVVGKPVHPLRLRQTLAEAVAADAPSPAAPPVETGAGTPLDTALLDQMREALGPEEMARLLAPALETIALYCDIVVRGVEEAGGDGANDDARIAAHKLAGAAASHGLRAVAAQARAIETALLCSDRAAARAAAAGLGDGLAIARATLALWQERGRG